MSKRAFRASTRFSAIGLVGGALYLIEGMAGAGKTILSSQIGFHRVLQGEKVLYMTLIAESHDKLLGHLSGLSFFDEKAVAEKILRQDRAIPVRKKICERNFGKDQVGHASDGRIADLVALNGVHLNGVLAEGPGGRQA